MNIKTSLFLLIFCIFSVPILTYGVTVGPSKAYLVRYVGTANHDDYLTMDFQISFDNQVSPGQQVNVSGQVVRGGRDITTSFTLSSQQTGSISFSPSVFSAIGTRQPTTYSLNSGSFIAPSAPGSYIVNFNADETPTYQAPEGMEIVTPIDYWPDSAVITVVATQPQCSDSQDNNDNDTPPLSDEDDPQCHTDCNPNNPTSYVPNHNSESTPPNGTCPAAPTLNLNGRAAFLQVVKNFVAFITTKAFAGE